LPAKRAQIYSGKVFGPHPPPLCMDLFQKRGNYPLLTLGPPGSFTVARGTRLTGWSAGLRLLLSIQLRAGQQA